MKIGVVGGRNFTDFSKLCSVLDNHIPAPTMIISGGAPGADNFAYLYAKDRGITFVCHPPLKGDLELYGFARSAKRRNLRIVESSDKIIAFPTSSSKGTWHTIGLAKKLNKECEVIK